MSSPIETSNCYLKLLYPYADGWSIRTIDIRSSQKMLLHPLIFVLAVPLSSLAAPIDKSSGYYSVFTPTPVPEGAKPTCYRRWRRHGSHITFRLARLSVCAPEPSDRSQDVATPKLDKPKYRPETESDRISGIVPRHHRHGARS